MAKLQITKGMTDVTLNIFAQDSSVTTGAGLTGLAYNTSSLTCYYARARAAATAISLVTQTATGAHSDGGFVSVDGTNMPGIYRLDLPDAVCATGVDSVCVMLKGATNLAPVVLEIELIDVNLRDTVRAGLTCLPNAVVNAANGLMTYGTGTGQITAASGLVSAGTVSTGAITTASFASGAINAAAIADGAIDDGSLASDARTRITTQAAAALTAINLDHLVFSAVDTSLANTVADNSVIGYLAATSVVSAYDRTTDSQQATVDNSVTPADVADAVYDEARSGHTTAGTYGATLPTTATWTDVRAGYLDAAITSRLAPTVAGRTLDVAAGGEAGIDWSNINGPTYTQTLSGTTIGIATSLGSYESHVIVTGTAQAGAARAITLAATASATNQLYRGLGLKLCSGTGAGQARYIVDYNGSTKVVTTDADWVVTPDATTTYSVYLVSPDVPMPELLQAQPTTTPTLRQANMLQYMAIRNASTATSSSKTIANDGGTVICKSSLSDDGSTFTRAKLVGGP